jgi:hypothetical protein
MFGIELVFIACVISGWYVSKPFRKMARQWILN